MKNLFRICAVLSVALLCAFAAQAQQVPTRAEYECIRLMSSRQGVPPGPPDKAITYHHVWVPNLKTFRFASDGLNLAYNVEGTGKELVVVISGGAGLPRPAGCFGGAACCAARTAAQAQIAASDFIVDIIRWRRLRRHTGAGAGSVARRASISLK